MELSRRARIEELKEQIRDVTDGQVVFDERQTCPPEIEEPFLERVLWYEKVSRQPLGERLAEAGVVMPNPESLDDRQITGKLWEVIHALVVLKIIVANTDHLSDRELYTYLWNEVSRNRISTAPDLISRGWYIDVTGTGGEGIDIYLKYYATEAERKQYRLYYPDRTVPEHTDPPFNRDHLIPDL